MQTDGMTQNEICQEILKQWDQCRAAAREEKTDETVAVDIQIARIMEQQALCVVPQKKTTEEERRLKQSILSQYAQVYEHEDLVRCWNISDLPVFRFLTGKRGLMMKKVGMIQERTEFFLAIQTPRTWRNSKNSKRNLYV